MQPLTPAETELAWQRIELDLSIAMAAVNQDDDTALRTLAKTYVRRCRFLGDLASGAIAEREKNANKNSATKRAVIRAGIRRTWEAGQG